MSLLKLERSYDSFFKVKLATKKQSTKTSYYYSLNDFFEQSIVHLTPGSHDVELAMFSDGAIRGNFRASFDNILIKRNLVADVIGGELIPIESTTLLLAGAQTFSWMIPVVLSVLGIGLFVVSRKSENS